jgi:hypothetical protein
LGSQHFLNWCQQSKALSEVFRPTSSESLGG